MTTDEEIRQDLRAIATAQDAPTWNAFARRWIGGRCSAEAFRIIVQNAQEECRRQTHPPQPFPDRDIFGGVYWRFPWNRRGPQKARSLAVMKEENAEARQDAQARQDLDRFLEYWPSLVGSEAERRFVEAVDAETCELLAAYYRDGLTQTQIADRLGISQPAVSQRISRICNDFEELARHLGPLHLPQVIPAPDALDADDRRAAAELSGHLHPNGMEIVLPPVPQYVEKRLARPENKAMVAARRDLRRQVRSVVEGALIARARQRGHNEDDTDDIIQIARAELAGKVRRLRGLSEAEQAKAAYNAVEDVAKVLYDPGPRTVQVETIDVEAAQEGKPKPRTGAHDEEENQQQWAAWGSAEAERRLQEAAG